MICSLCQKDCIYCWCRNSFILAQLLWLIGLSAGMELIAIKKNGLDGLIRQSILITSPALTVLSYRKVTDNNFKSTMKNRSWLCGFVLTSQNAKREGTSRGLWPWGGFLVTWMSASDLRHLRPHTSDMLEPGQRRATTADASHQLHMQNTTSVWRNRRAGITDLAAVFITYLESEPNVRTSHNTRALTKNTKTNNKDSKTALSANVSWVVWI